MKGEIKGQPQAGSDLFIPTTGTDFILLFSYLFIS